MIRAACLAAVPGGPAPAQGLSACDEARAVSACAIEEIGEMAEDEAQVPREQGRIPGDEALKAVARCECV